MSLTKLVSSLDNSVNFVFDGNYPGKMEARYVRRTPEYFICYLSSQTGCDHGCRMCHLTATKQTDNIDVSPGAFAQQAEVVVGHYMNNLNTQPKARMIHYNFMARGEPLANQYILRQPERIFRDLADITTPFDLSVRFCISTIMPQTLHGKRLSQIFKVTQPDFYYSVYSTNEKFRKKWLPKALPVKESMRMLKDWQRDTGKIIKLHWAFIKDENDDFDDMRGIFHEIMDNELRVNINIVKYNSYSVKYGEEATEERIKLNVNYLNMLFKGTPTRIKVVDRIGMDVHASCGMFV